MPDSLINTYNILLMLLWHELLLPLLVRVEQSSEVQYYSLSYMAISLKLLLCTVLLHSKFWQASLFSDNMSFVKRFVSQWHYLVFYF